MTKQFPFAALLVLVILGCSPSGPQEANTEQDSIAADPGAVQAVAGAEVPDDKVAASTESAFPDAIIPKNPCDKIDSAVVSDSSSYYKVTVLSSGFTGMEQTWGSDETWYFGKDFSPRYFTVSRHEYDTTRLSKKVIALEGNQIKYVREEEPLAEGRTLSIWCKLAEGMKITWKNVQDTTATYQPLPADYMSTKQLEFGKSQDALRGFVNEGQPGDEEIYIIRDQSIDGEFYNISIDKDYGEGGLKESYRVRIPIAVYKRFHY